MAQVELTRLVRDLRDELATQVSVLIVDDEPTVRILLEESLKVEGFRVQGAESAEEAWPILAGDHDFGLVIVDKNLPGESGLDMLRKLQQTHEQLPAILMTAYPSSASVGEAFDYGAWDFITKPFPDLNQMLARIRSVCDRQLAGRFYDALVGRLTEALHAEAPDRAILSELAGDLFQFKNRLEVSPDMLIWQADRRRTSEWVEGLRGAARDVAVADTPEELVKLLSDELAPLCVVVDVDHPGGLDAITAIREADPLAEILATSKAERVDAATSAVDAGATEYFLHEEGIKALDVRAGRCARRSRRHRLYAHLIGRLGVALQKAGGETSALLASLPLLAHRGLVEEQATDLDLDDVDIDLGGDLDGDHPVLNADSLADALEPDTSAIILEQEDAERRGATRTNVSLRARVHLLDEDGDIIDARIRDVSETGMFVRMTRIPLIGSEIEVLINDREENWVLTGTVVRTVRYEPDPGGHSGIGVEVEENSVVELGDIIEMLEVHAAEAAL